MKSKFIFMILIAYANFLAGASVNPSNHFLSNNSVAPVSSSDLGAAIDLARSQHATIDSLRTELKDTKNSYRKYILVGAGAGFFAGAWAVVHALRKRPELLERIVQKS